MKLLKDKYKLLEKIDEDEKVMLFLAQTVKEPVVNINIRTLKQRRLKNPDFVQRYTQEFQTMAALDSPLFLKIFDIDFYQDVFFVASEHVEGKSLHTILKEREKLSLAQIINIVTQLTRAFGHALRENVKYRSLTYSDIIYQVSGKIKILQFHIPRDVISNKDFENKISSVGSDIFFTGCLFYELLTHKPLFEADGISVRNMKTVKDFRLDSGSVKNIGPQQLEALKNIIFKCVTSDISARYQSIDELLEALVKFVSDQINKTDVLSSMQVDPSKFMKPGEEPSQPRRKTEGAKNKAGEILADIKIPSFGGPEKCAAPDSTRNSPGAASAPRTRDDSDAYAILFGRKGASENKRAAYQAPETDMGPVSEQAASLNADGRETEINSAENQPPEAGLKNFNIKAAGRKEAGEMWNNKKTAGAKSLLAKIANFWYSMLFVIAGFLSFLLYVFW
ncbi:MAG: Serine/threonine-protein kinase PrkC [bacterium ADurb.Bin243]|nr:MAG: Serine/threonine-protein kinase PrkC [bacterium ADurb.Bin243]HOD39411.1 protein kinase [Candidatus Wallbacteria bacterium]